MCKRLVLLISVVLVLCLASGVRAQTLQVPPNHTVTGSETYHEMYVDEGGTVTVPSGASLTIEIQGTGEDYEKNCNIDGGTLVVEGDFLCHQGTGRMNTQIDENAQSTIFMDGNSFAVSGWFLLGDNDVGSTAMYVRAGTTTIGSLAGGYMSLRGFRGARAYIGGGELIIYNTSTEEDRDPCNWVEQGWLLPDAGYGLVNIEDDYGGVTGCARITATIGAPIAMPPTIPTDGATNVCPQGLVLSWTPGDKVQDVNAHEIYFGTDYDIVSEANLSEPCGVYMGAQDRDSNTYPLGALEFAKTYYWRVDEVNEDDPNIRWEGNVWQFTTEDGKADILWPTDGLKGIAYSQVVLEWEPSCLADTHKVYFSSDWNDVNDGTALMDTLPADDTNYVPSSLEPFKWYYWRIGEVSDSNEVKSDIWSFRTGLGGVLVHFRFDGTPGEDFEPNVTDYTGNVTFTKVIGNPPGSLKYSADSAFGITGGASAEFEPRASLVRNDPAPADGFDILRLDVYQYTVEFWVKLNDVTGDTELFRKEGYMELDKAEENYTQLRWFHPHEDMYSDAEAVPLGEWNHVACVFDLTDIGSEMKMWINGISQGVRDNTNLLPGDNTKSFKIGQGNEWLDGKMDELRILDVALDRDEFLWTPGPEWASNPNPRNLAVSVDPNDPNVVLSWTPGTKAVTHNVYFSTNYDEVYDSCSAALIAELPVDSNEVNDVNFIFGRTYYWRVTEVNEADYPYQWPGVIWKFTTKFLIIDPDMIVWYKFDDGEGQTVLDSSGYEHHAEATRDPVVFPTWDPDGQFGGCMVFDDDTFVQVPTDVLGSIGEEISISVWLNGLDGQNPDNDMVIFDVGDEGGTYKMTAVVPTDHPDYDVYWRAGNDTNDLLVWDTSSGTTSAWQDDWHHLVFIKDESADRMRIYFDGEQAWWKKDTIESLSNVKDKEFKIGAYTDTAGDYEGRIDDFRVYNIVISESKILELFRGGDLDVAWAPSPYDGQPDAPHDANLVWKPGDHVADHNVFFGASEQEVANMSEPCDTLAVGNEDYEPGLLELDTYYYWRIDEVNGPCTWPGPVWRFKTAQYIVVDDFEAYNLTTNKIEERWWDYYQQWYSMGQYPITCSWLLLGEYPWEPVYTGGGGSQSMNYIYDMKTLISDWAQVCYAEAWLPIPEEDQDWTAGGVRLLRLYFYGDSDNDTNNTEQMYIGLEDTDGKYAEVRYGEYDPENEDMNDLKIEEWYEWNIGLPHFNDTNYAAVANDVNLASVAKFYIGFGDRRNPPTPGPGCGGDGFVMFDDIRLHMPTCVPEYGPEADFSGNCIVDMADVGIMAEAWLKHDVNYGPGEMQEPNDANLVGWWRLDEGDGNKAEDFSKYDHNGVIEGSYWWVTGHNDVNENDAAVQFTGSGGRILVGDTNELRPKYEVSVSAWIYYSQEQGNDRRIVAKGQNDEETYEIEINGEDETLFRVRDVNGSKFDITEVDVWPNDWVHLTGTCDGNSLKYYVNGQPAGENDEPDGIILSQDTAGLAVGNRSDATDRPFIGAIDEVCVYNYALSEAEVRWLATDGTGYVPLTLPYNLYDKEEPGKQAINFKDFAELLDDWMEEILYP